MDSVSKRNWSEASVPTDEGQLKINRQGTGVNLNWKALIGIIVATALAVWYAASIVNTVNNHSETLAVIKSDIHHINIKVDAVLIKSGLDPAKVVRERDGEDRQP